MQMVELWSAWTHKAKVKCEKKESCRTEKIIVIIITVRLFTRHNKKTSCKYESFYFTHVHKSMAENGRDRSML